MRVLIVDDEPDVRSMVRTMVEHDVAGAEIVGEAGSGQEALGLCRSVHPDVIVLDQRMPGMSGLEVAAQILETDPATAIILFTAYLDRAVQARAAKLARVEVLPKERVVELPETLLRCWTAIHS